MRPRLRPSACSPLIWARILLSVWPLAPVTRPLVPWGGRAAVAAIADGGRHFVDQWFGSPIGADAGSHSGEVADRILRVRERSGGHPRRGRGSSAAEAADEQWY